MIREILVTIAATVGIFALLFYIFSIFSGMKKKDAVFDPKDPKMVSIIIPAFNEEKGIAKSIESAIGLDYVEDRKEVIVVDDGSRDNTYEIAKKFESKNVRVFKMKKNSGKGEALNFGIKKAKGEIIITMDADNVHVKKDSIFHMVADFQRDLTVMCVSPIIAVYNPKNILERIQQVEFLFGVFLRKAFEAVKAIHITPGAFSAYRKEFFERFGGFPSDNLTEDLEVALRIQKNHFHIVNNLNAVAYAPGPKRFMELLKQRRRWYVGLMRNLGDYRQLFSRRYGVLGMLILPVALFSVFISIVLTLFMYLKSIFDLRKDFILWKSIGFRMFENMRFDWFTVELFIFNTISDPMFLLTALFFVIIVGYIVFAKKYVGEHAKIKISVIFFIMFYALLYSLWWSIALVYIFINKKVSWR